jgi:signal peptidase II
LHGKVVDMLYFPIIRNAHFPLWIPIWGGEDFEFFRPIFNLADASITTGIITILVFQKRFFRTNVDNIHAKSVETGTLINDEMQVS